MTAAARRPFLLGVRSGLGVPALVMAGSFLGFGSLVHSADLGLWFGIASTATAWALPGQVMLVELLGVGASLVAIAVAVFLTNARLLPMVVTLLPHMRPAGEPRWRAYAYAHWIALTTWAVSMRHCQGLARNDRLPFFLGFAATLWTISLASTMAGFALAGLVPAPVTVALVFINPLYFLLMLVGDITSRMRALAIGLGCVLGPLLHLLVADWGLLITGVVGGTLAFLIHRSGAGRPRHG